MRKAQVIPQADGLIVLDVFRIP